MPVTMAIFFNGVVGTCSFFCPMQWKVVSSSCHTLLTDPIDVNCRASDRDFERVWGICNHIVIGIIIILSARYHASIGVPMLALAGLYIILKAYGVWQRSRLALAAYRLAFRDGALYGVYASPAEVAEQGGQCPICHDSPVKALKLECGHIYCGECLEEWGQREHSCPMCRKHFKPLDLKMQEHGAISLLPQVL